MPSKRTGTPSRARARDVFAPFPPRWFSIVSTKVVVPHAASSAGRTKVSAMMLPEHNTPRSSDLKAKPKKATNVVDLVAVLKKSLAETKKKSVRAGNKKIKRAA